MLPESALRLDVSSARSVIDPMESTPAPPLMYASVVLAVSLIVAEPTAAMKPAASAPSASADKLGSEVARMSMSPAGVATSAPSIPAFTSLCTEFDANEAPAAMPRLRATPAESASTSESSVAWRIRSPAGPTVAPPLTYADVLLPRSFRVTVPTPASIPAADRATATASTSYAEWAVTLTSPEVVVTVAPPMPARTSEPIWFVATDAPTPKPSDAERPPESVSTSESSSACTVTVGALIVPPLRVEASVTLSIWFSVTEANPPTMPATPNARASASMSYEELAWRSTVPDVVASPSSV